MREPTEEDIERVRSSALRDCGRGDLTMVQFEQADMAVVVRAPAAKEIAEYVDAAAGEDARVTLALRCVVWPSRDVVREAFERWPLFAGELCTGVIERACGVGVVSKVDLTSHLGVDELDVSGLTAEQGKELLAQFPHRGQLRAVAVEVDDDGQVLRFVIKQPSSFSTSRLLSTMGKTGWAQACLDAAVDCVVWPKSEAAVREVFGRWPLIPSAVLVSELLSMGSAGAITRRKKI